MDWDPPSMKRKVLQRWFLERRWILFKKFGSRTFEYQDTAKSYVGYRNVMTHLGRGGRDFDGRRWPRQFEATYNLR